MKDRLRTAMHALALLAVIGGIYRAAGEVDDAFAALYMIQYLLWAILFEVVALNLKDDRKF
ncbi:hypothetical protein [Candidatus Pyrohabitans sp.]